MRASMGDVGACWDNAVVERFFGSLKHDWVFKVHQPTRDFMKAYFRRPEVVAEPKASSED